MLELIRKYQYSVMVFVTVIIIFAFAWWGDFFGPEDAMAGRGQPFVSLGGKTYSQSQISKLAAGSQVAQRHFPFHAFQVERAYRRYEMQGLDYAVNTLALRKRAVDYGIGVSPEEIDKRMLSMPDFQTPEAREMAYRIYGSLGLGEGDVAQIVADVITMEKLSDLLSAGLLPSDAGVEYDYASRYQTIFSSAVTVPAVEPAAVEITEDELKEAYEAKKAELTTGREVAIRYVFFEAPAEPEEIEPGAGPTNPVVPNPENGAGGAEDAKPEDAKPDEAKPADAKPDEAKPDDAKPEDAKPEDAKPDEAKPEGANGSVDPEIKPVAPEGTPGAADGGSPGGCEGEESGKEVSTELGAPEAGGSEAVAPEGAKEVGEPEKPAVKEETPGAVPPVEAEKPAGLSTEEIIKRKKDFNALVDQFWGEFFQDGAFTPGVDFAERAKDARYGLEVVETGLFSSANPPEEIAGERDLISAAVSKSMDPPVSDPIAASGEKKGYYIFEILKIVEPREKTFEEAKKDLEEGLRRDKATEATVAAADAAREKIVAAMAGGKSFAEAAVVAGMEAKELKPFSPSEPPGEPANLRQLLPALISVVPGEVSEPVDVFPEGKVLVFVLKRELWKRENAETMKEGVKSNAVSSQGFDLLGRWFSEVREGWDEKVL